MSQYEPVNFESFGTTISCMTLARMLNELEDSNLSRKVSAHINKSFKFIKRLSTIEDTCIRKTVGNMLLERLDYLGTDLSVPSHIGNVIRNVKIAYIKDLMISEVALNYKR